MKKKLCLPIIPVAIVLILVAHSLLVTQRSVTAKGTIKTVDVGIYWDYGCTENVTFIDWGAIEPGSKTDVPIYLRNEGNVDAMMNLTTSEWSPIGVEEYITLSWNYTGEKIIPSQVISVNFSLIVSSNITGIKTFEFVITVTATG